MADKYGKYLLKAPMGISKHEPPIPVFEFAGADYNVNASFSIVPTTRPLVATDRPHTHNTQQFICFLGSNPYNIGDLGAEIEISLGEEREKHLIATPTMINIKPGLVHGPLVYKKVDRPIYEVSIFFAPGYERIPLSK